MAAQDRPTPGRLEGKRAVVAGVGPGMGSAIGHRLATQGAHVLLVARNESRLQATVAAIRADGGTAEAVAADLASPDAVDRLVATAIDRLGGPPHILVNAVGTWRAGGAEDPDGATVDTLLEANLKTVLTTTPRFARVMADAGGGTIVNLAATYGPLVASKGQAAYNATKAGIAGYTRSAAADLLDRNIRVNAVLPGGTTHDFVPGRDHRALRHLGKDRIGRPEDVADAVLFLVSDEASWITGALLPVDGGESVRS